MGPSSGHPALCVLDSHQAYLKEAMAREQNKSHVFHMPWLDPGLSGAVGVERGIGALTKESPA